MLESTTIAPDEQSLLESVLDHADEDLLAINPSRATIERLVRHLSGDDGPMVRVLADDQSLKEVMDDFLVAGPAADLLAADRLALRTVTDAPQNSLLVSSTGVVSVVQAVESVAGLTTTDEDFVRDAYDHFQAIYEAATEFTLRTPPLSAVLDSLASEIGEETAADFEAVLDSLETARGNGEGLDEVTISLLVAARNGELLYDISKWGEDVGLASKATFSRTKTHLEDEGLVDTEKVPIDVGRPRLRLMPGDDRLTNGSPGAMATTAATMLE
jgi:hypothetical protein